LKTLVRILAAVAIAALTVGPVSAATAPSDALTTVAQAVSTGSVSGTLLDQGGSAIASATVKLTGPGTYSTTTDAKGAFSVSDVKPGIYVVTATRAGFNGAEVDDLAVVAGTNSIVNATMSAVTFNSTLHEIIRTTAHRGTVFNTSTASSAIVSAQDFQDQAQTQVAKVLDETPGIVIDHPGTSATYAAPGAITFPSIRGSLGFETASLIDGHPLAVGLFGDYVTSFLNSYFLQSAEVIKGPGAASPNVNYAIGGLVNFRTKDPTAIPTFNAQFSTNTNGGKTMNLLYTGTTYKGKIGWVLGYGDYGQNGPLDNSTNYWDIPRFALVNGQNFSGFTTNPIYNYKTNGIWNNVSVDNSQVLACCFPVSQTYSNKTEVAKLKINLSSATTITGSYLGSQTWTDQNGNHVYGYMQQFTPCGPAVAGGSNPCAGYTGALTPGQRYMTWQNVFTPPGEWEVNNEPIFQGELRTTLGKDTILARYYGASINRLQSTAQTSPYDSFSLQNTAYGAYCTGSTGTGNGYGACSGSEIYYNGVPVTIRFDANSNAQYYCTKTTAPLNWATNPTTTNGGSTPTLCKYNAAGNLVTSGAYTSSHAAAFYNSFFFRSAEEDKIHGTSFQYEHPFNIGSNADDLTVSYDRNSFRTHAYSYAGAPNAADSVPDGSAQTIGTLLARATFQFGDKWSAMLAGYVNNYDTTWSGDGGFTFSDTKFNHNDARVGLTFRPTTNTIWRFAAGSAIAPPYLGLYGVGSNPSCVVGNNFCTNKQQSNSILPETSFGYDIGGSTRFSKDLGTEFSWDAYSSTLWNQFSSQSYVSCQNFDTVTLTCLGATGPTTVPLITSQNINLTNVRYTGIEMQLQRRPTIGFGYKVQGALLRAYPYNLPPCFYSTNPVAPPPGGCNALQTNLAVPPDQNFNGNGTSGLGAGTGSYNGVNNHNIPYAQGYGELSYRFVGGAYASFGEQLYGHHNSLNLPAFWVANATLRVPGGKNLTVQGSVSNIFNVYSNLYSTLGAGIPIPLVNGFQGLTNANSIGPRTFTLSLNFRTGGTP